MWQSQTIESNGIRLHYTRTSQTGNGKPTLVLLHGFSDDGLCWTPIAQALENTYDILMVDARGHGRSEGPPTGYGHDQHAADVADLIKKLNLRKPLVLGHSMGAVTTLMLAASYPDLPGAILLEDPPPFWAPPKVLTEQNQRRSGMGQWIVELKRKTFDEMMAENRANEPNWPEGEREPWVNSKIRMSFNVLNGFTENRDLDMRKAVTQITCPALLLIADTARGGITSAEQAADLHSLVPQLKIAHITNAGHSIRRDQPAAYLDAVRAFLAAA